MILAMCGQCGWLGGTEALEIVEGISDEMLDFLSESMKGNKEASYLACPTCHKRDIFYKSLDGSPIGKSSIVPGNQQIVMSPQVIEEEPKTAYSPDPEEEVFVEEDEPQVNLQKMPQFPPVDPNQNPMMAMMTMFQQMLEQAQGKKPEEQMLPLADDEMFAPPKVDSAGRPLEEGKQPITVAERDLFCFTCKCDECKQKFKSKVEGATRCLNCTKSLVSG